MVAYVWCHDKPPFLDVFLMANLWVCGENLAPPWLTQDCVVCVCVCELQRILQMGVLQHLEVAGRTPVAQHSVLCDRVLKSTCFKCC